MAEENKTEQTAGSQEDYNFPGRFITPIFFNQYYTVVGSDTTRITFGEYAFRGQEPTWSSVVVMPTYQAIHLARTILSLAQQQGLIPKEDSAHGKAE